MDFPLSWLAGCSKLLSEQFLPLWFEMAHLFSKFSWYLSISGIFDSAPWQSVCLSCASIMHVVLVVVLTIIAGYNRDEYIFFIFFIWVFVVSCYCKCGNFLTSYGWYVKRATAFLYLYFEISYLTDSLNSSKSFAVCFPGVHK